MTGRAGRTFPAPVKAAHSWIQGIEFTKDTPLIDVSQAAPADLPPPALRDAMAQFVMEEKEAHLYGPILGMARLRSAMAAHCKELYTADITTNHIAITSGCNQAFCAAIAALADEGDNVILVAPWYFNHKMWLDMTGIKTQALMCSRDMLPNPNAAAALISHKTRAICLVTPNNPAGIAYPDKLLHAFFDLAESHGIALILDETYKDFHPNAAFPHSLCARRNAFDTLIQLFSFSKSFRLTGHRVGAIATAPKRLTEIEKFLDTVTICPPQVGQYGAYWGLLHLSDWMAEQRAEMQKRCGYLKAEFSRLSDVDWKLLGAGGYFAYVEHPFQQSSGIIAQTILQEAAILCLPGIMFAPTEANNAHKELRIAFANIGCEKIETLIQRLHKVSLTLASRSTGK